MDYSWLIELIFNWYKHEFNLDKKSKSTGRIEATNDQNVKRSWKQSNVGKHWIKNAELKVSLSIAKRERERKSSLNRQLWWEGSGYRLELHSRQETCDLHDTSLVDTQTLTLTITIGHMFPV